MELLSPSYGWRNPAVFCPPPLSARPRALPLGPAPPPASHCRCCSGEPSATFKNNVLLSAAAKRGPLDRALALFCFTRDRDTVTWNTVMSACLRQGRPRSALQLFVEMLLAGKDPPDAITIRGVLRACVELGEFHLGLVNLYHESGQMRLARHLFHRIPQKDVVAFTSMMTGCSKAGDYEEALRIFVGMLGEDNVQANEYVLSCALRASAGVCSSSAGQQIHAHVIKLCLGSDVVVGTSLVDMYAKCGSMESAKSAFLCISEPNTVAWNSLIDGCSCGPEALWLFSRMRLMDVSPDCTTFASVLRACKDCSFWELSQETPQTSCSAAILPAASSLRG